MFCHLCTQHYPDFENFRIHITEMHGNSSEFSNESSESEESEHENAEVSEIDYENGNKSNGPAVLFTSPAKYYDDDNESNGNIAVLNSSARKYDCAESNKSHVKASVKNTSSRKSNVARDKSFVNKTTSKYLPKKKKVSDLKKRKRKEKKMQKQKKKVFSEKVLPKRKKSAASSKKDLYLKSKETNQLESSVNDVKEETVDTYSIFNDNCVNSQSVTTNNLAFSHPTSNNNPVFLIIPCAGQNANSNYIPGNQAPLVYVVNPVINGTVAPKNGEAFGLNSKNTSELLIELKKNCKRMSYPLPSSYFNLVKALHKKFFDHYCIAPDSEEASAVLKTYEELDCMIHKHINSINNKLSVL